MDVGYNLGFGLTDVVEYLKKLDIKNLDGIILTHPHPDHYWNLKYVFQKFNVEKFCHSYMDKPKKLINKINSLKYDDRVMVPLKNFREKNGKVLNVALRINELKKNHNIYSDDNFNMKALEPMKKHKDVNDNSLVLFITYEDKKILFMSDAGIEVEKELIQKYGNMIKRVDMVKIRTSWE